MAETSGMNSAAVSGETNSMSEREGVNPQEASTPSTEEEEPKGDGDRYVNTGSDKYAPAKSTGHSTGTTSRKVKKRGRHVWAVNIEDDATIPRCSRLPPHQFETELQRRAIRKKEVSVRPKSPLSVLESMKAQSDDSAKFYVDNTATTPKNPEESTSVEEPQQTLEQYGDVALGMKLTIVGGKVIVEGLNALSDGRASPAQLTGLIQRGDVLLSVDNVSLVNMPLNQLVEGLKPLSTPLNGSSYQRMVHLRFAAGQGLAVLNKREAQMLKKASSADSATDMFSISNFMPRDVPMVDNLSGLPILDHVSNGKEVIGRKEKIDEPVVATPKRKQNDPMNKMIEPLTGYPQMALQVAKGREWERQRLTSTFFASEDHCSDLLRPTVISLDSTQGSYDAVFTLAEMLENGQRAMEGAKALFYSMEDRDKGSDNRSFRKWNSQISLRSRASSRRKHLLETTSRAESNKESCSSSVASAGSSISDELLDGMDGDDMLLGLAAHDEIWRRQVIETLQQAAREVDPDREEVDADSRESKNAATTNLDTAMSIELGSLLFGAQMSRIITKKKRPLALPPAEVTSVLFDLTTNLASVMPDQIVSQGSLDHGPLKSSLPSFVKSKQSHLDRNVRLATQFVANEALPAWLKSFRPLPREQRRILWPRSRTVVGDSHTISSYSQALSEDSLTLDSESTGNLPSSKKSKSLQERIEDMELDSETREETCYLATIYLTQVLLPKLQGPPSATTSETFTEKDAANFVDHYGVYLTLHTCLACAAVVGADRVVKSLLRVAKHDPCHQDAMKALSKTSGLLLYEPTTLSALLRNLRNVRKDMNADDILRLLTLCASAFPDLRPWQVRSALLEDTPELDQENAEKERSEEQPLEALYYRYLSLLMHPVEGHEGARRDPALVEEWCTMSMVPLDTDDDDSTTKTSSDKRRDNFIGVASTTSSDHQLYFRDLTFLLNLSMRTGEFDIALEIAGEMIQDDAFPKEDELLLQVLSHLRSISRASVNVAALAPSGIDIPRLRTTLRLYDCMAKNPLVSSRQSFVFSDELFSLLMSSHRCRDTLKPTDAEIELIDILVESTDPHHCLPMLALWARSRKVSPNLLTYLRRSLLRGMESGIRSELSGSLLRIMDARKSEDLCGEPFSSPQQGRSVKDGDNIWNRMFSGDAAIDK